VKLAVRARARDRQTPAIFWLDRRRAHDAQVIAKVERIPQGPRHHRARPSEILSPVDAMKLSLARMREARTRSR
jgi:isocitrate dehydrogenase